MKSKIKPLPALMTFLSGLYVVYVLMSKDTTLRGDAVGGDPGGKFLPLIMGAFMFLGFLWLTVKERPSEERSSRKVRILFAATAGLSALYVLVIRPVGYIIATTALLYTLLIMYAAASRQPRALVCVGVGAGALAATSGVFVLMRLATKGLMGLARSGALPALFKSAPFNGFLSALLAAVFTLAFKLAGSRLAKAKDARLALDCAIIAFATVLFLYIVFKQFFSVNLAPGILNI